MGSGDLWKGRLLDCGPGVAPVILSWTKRPGDLDWECTMIYLLLRFVASWTEIQTEMGKAMLLTTCFDRLSGLGRNKVVD